MILITLFLGIAIAVKSDDEPKGYREVMYFPPSRPIYERPTLNLGDGSPQIDEKKNMAETKYGDGTKYVDGTNVDGTKYVDKNKYVDGIKYVNEIKYVDGTNNVDENKYKDDKKHAYPIDLQERDQSKGFPSSNYFLPTKPLVGKPAKTLGEWYPYNDERKAYFYPNDLFEQMLASNRLKRDAAGALRIQTNHALPIHADVKPVGSSEPVGVSELADTAVTVTEKPCPPSKYKPSHIENGVVFQVTAPEDTIYEVKSLRKSLLPLPNKLEIARSINRIITIVVLLTCAVLEFYPLLETLFNLLYTFVYL